MGLVWGPQSTGGLSQPDFPTSYLGPKEGLVRLESGIEPKSGTDSTQTRPILCVSAPLCLCDQDPFAPLRLCAFAILRHWHNKPPQRKQRFGGRP